MAGVYAKEDEGEVRRIRAFYGACFHVFVVFQVAHVWLPFTLFFSFLSYLRPSDDSSYLSSALSFHLTRTSQSWKLRTYSVTSSPINLRLPWDCSLALAFGLWPRRTWSTCCTTQPRQTLSCKSLNSFFSHFFFTSPIPRCNRTLSLVVSAPPCSSWYPWMNVLW